MLETILAALMVPWAPFFKVSGVFWAAFWELWAPFGSILRGLVVSGAPWAAQRWHSDPPRRPGPNFPKFPPPFWEPFWIIFGRKNRSKNQSIFHFIFRCYFGTILASTMFPKTSQNIVPNYLYHPSLALLKPHGALTP